jgi:hypothetical protein
MPSETDLIIQAINKVQEDIRCLRENEIKYIRDKTDIQGEKISELCTRTALTTKEIDLQIKTKVQSETKLYKMATFTLTAITSLTTILYYLTQTKII